MRQIVREIRYEKLHSTLLGKSALSILIENLWRVSKEYSLKIQQLVQNRATRHAQAIAVVFVLNQLGRNVFKKIRTALSVHVGTTVEQGTVIVAGAGDDQFVLGAGEGDIEHAAFLVLGILVAQAAQVGIGARLHAQAVTDRGFGALGAVHGNHRERVFLFALFRFGIGYRI